MSVIEPVLFAPTLMLLLTVCGPTNPPVFVAAYVHWAGKLDLLVMATFAFTPFCVMVIATSFAGAAHCWPAGTVALCEPAGQLTGAAAVHCWPAGTAGAAEPDGQHE